MSAYIQIRKLNVYDVSQNLFLDDNKKVVVQKKEDKKKYLLIIRFALSPERITFKASKGILTRADLPGIIAGLLGQVSEKVKVVLKGAFGLGAAAAASKYGRI